MIHKFSFPTWACHTAPAKKGGKKKGPSATNEVVTRQYTISIHKCIMEWVPGSVPLGHSEIWKFAVKEMGTPDVHTDTRLNTAGWAEGTRDVPRRSQVQLSRKHNVDGDSPNRLYMLVPYVRVTTFKILQTVNVNENSLLFVK